MIQDSYILDLSEKEKPFDVRLFDMQDFGPFLISGVFISVDSTTGFGRFSR